MHYVIGSRLSTDGTNPLLINSLVLTRIFELDFGTDSSTTCAMVVEVVVEKIEEHPVSSEIR